MTALEPPLGELADADDELGWDRDRDGRMVDQATPDDDVDLEDA